MSQVSYLIVIEVCRLSCHSIDIRRNLRSFCKKSDEFIIIKNSIVFSFVFGCKFDAFLVSNFAMQFVEVSVRNILHNLKWNMIAFCVVFHSESDNLFLITIWD